MDSNFNVEGGGPVCAVISIIAIPFAWMGVKETQVALAMIASLIAICSGIMAIRYYWYATKRTRDK
jgi:cytosine/uracil/thiamine/allantoin permease